LNARNGRIVLQSIKVQWYCCKRQIVLQNDDYSDTDDSYKSDDSESDSDSTENDKIIEENNDGISI